MTIKVQGRLLEPEQIQGLRQLIAEHPEWSRRRLSEELCRRWEWRDPKGQPQDMAVRSASACPRSGIAAHGCPMHHTQTQ